MTAFSLTDHPHRRYNPLTGEWVLNSPHRNRRPWLGKEESVPPVRLPQYDPDCYLCPGNKRAGGVQNPDFADVFVFDNNFAALLDDPYDAPSPDNPLLRIEVPRGKCRVVCFSPRHDLTLPEWPITGVKKVIEAWAIDPLPNEPAKEDRSQLLYAKEHGTVLLMDYQELESSREERIIVENEHWLAVVPFWAIWPFESMILPRRHILHLPDLNDEERTDLAEPQRDLTPEQAAGKLRTLSEKHFREQN